MVVDCLHCFNGNILCKKFGRSRKNLSRLRLFCTSCNYNAILKVSSLHSSPIHNNKRLYRNSLEIKISEFFDKCYLTHLKM